MKTAVVHSLCLEDECTETWIGLVPEDYTEEIIKQHWKRRGRETIYVFFTDGFEVSML